MWHFIALFVYAISGACATSNDIFAQVDIINRQQNSAYLVASNSGYDEVTLDIHPKNLGLAKGLANGLIISMKDLEDTLASVDIQRGNSLRATIQMMRFSRPNGNENFLLQVYTNGKLQTSASYCTNQENAQNTKKPQVSMSPALVEHNILRTELSFDLPKSLDSHTYTLIISMVLNDLPRFKIFCKTTKQEEKIFDLVYHADTVEPKVLA